MNNGTKILIAIPIAFFSIWLNAWLITGLIVNISNQQDPFWWVVGVWAAFALGSGVKAGLKEARNNP